jgi:hypothetical protein
MTKDEMIKGLRYKAENIKAHMEPEFFAEIADYLESQKWVPIEKGHPEKYENVLVKDINGDVTCARIWEDPCDSMVFCEFFSGEPIDDVIEWRRIPE